MQGKGTQDMTGIPVDMLDSRDSQDKPKGQENQGKPGQHRVKLPAESNPVVVLNILLPVEEPGRQALEGETLASVAVVDIPGLALEVNRVETQAVRAVPPVEMLTMDSSHALGKEFVDLQPHFAVEMVF